MIPDWGRIIGSHASLKHRKSIHENQAAMQNTTCQRTSRLFSFSNHSEALLFWGMSAKFPPSAAEASKKDETDTSAPATGRVTSHNDSQPFK
jgi:hypothetical protein